VESQKRAGLNRGCGGGHTNPVCVCWRNKLLVQLSPKPQINLT
jgi:hypothetical protein